jgi:ubiquinone/menaquinone biosynthesis C-methylase UbiE
MSLGAGRVSWATNRGETVAELPDHSAEAAMAIISDHHWTDRAAGLREMVRVARSRLLVLNIDPAMWDRFWLAAD